MKKRKGLIIFSLFLLMATTPLLDACAKATPAATSVEPIKIGLVEDASGPLGAYGTMFLTAGKLAVQMVNDAGGIKSLGGAKVVYAIGSGDSTPATSTSEVERLITAEKVVAISGPTGTAEVLATVPIFERYKIAEMNAGTDQSNFQKGYRYIFSPGPSGEMCGKLQADFIDWLTKKYGAPTDKIAICTLTPAYRGWGDGLVPRLGELGYKNIVLNETFPGTVTDQSPLVLKLKNANPGLVVYEGAVADTIAFLKACSTFDYYPWLVTTQFNFQVRDGLPADAAKNLLARPNAFGVGTNTPTDLYTRMPALKAFQDAFQKANPGNKMDPATVALGAQKTFLILKAISDAGSRNPEDIASALRKVDIQAPDPYLVWADHYPRITMSDSGMATTGSIPAAQWSDDLSILQVVYPESLASATPRIKK